ncbi:MAG: GDP-mannose 4,6-dehydratase [Flavobacteriales bacterium]|nr:GDP-mannose 4,6-dehydratase [Flavobacteriales bacterium]|tara:strand:- start:14 stop:1048 length:1035 start_codon:yes stop_codon:yes gene_type:complete
MKKAFVTGITGQDGAYLAQFLLEKGYEVYGAYRRTSSLNLWRIQFLNIENHPNLHLIEFNILDAANCIRVISQIQPNEVYNLAAQSFVGVSFEQPLLTSQTTGVGAVNLLESIRIVNPKIKYYQASTSEMFGKVQEIPQTESTRFYPRSPYGVAKLFAHWMTVNYRESYGIFASSGILFNHESPLRGIEFVTRKITDAAAKYHLGMQDVLELGNLNASRDWGYAKEYIEGMYLMLQHDKSDTFVLATNKTYTVRYFAEMAFKAIGVDIEWQGKDENERGINKANGTEIVRVNPKFFRPCEVDLLIGDPVKAKNELGWEPKTDIEELCKIMVDSDIIRNKNNASF